MRSEGCPKMERGSVLLTILVIKVLTKRISARIEYDVEIDGGSDGAWATIHRSQTSEAGIHQAWEVKVSRNIRELIVSQMLSGTECSHFGERSRQSLGAAESRLSCICLQIKPVVEPRPQQILTQ